MMPSVPSLDHPLLISMSPCGEQFQILCAHWDKQAFGQTLGCLKTHDSKFHFIDSGGRKQNDKDAVLLDNVMI